MRVGSKGRYAVIALIDVAQNSGQGPVPLADVAERQKISLSYLEQLFGKLRRAELVESTRGPGGGYSLGRAAEEITVADVILAVDEPLDATGCGGSENCMGDDAGKCMTHDLWSTLNQKMLDFLCSVTLKKLVDDQLARGAPMEETKIKRAISPMQVVKPIKINATNSVFALGGSVGK